MGGRNRAKRPAGMVRNTHLQVDPDRLLAGELPHPEEKDMELLELEGELELRRHLREQLEILEHLKLCP